MSGTAAGGSGPGPGGSTSGAGGASVGSGASGAGGRGNGTGGVPGSDASTADARSDASGGGSVGGSSSEGGTCPSPVHTDPLLAQRTACTFKAGSNPRDTLGITAQEQQSIPIKHIIVMMKENRSFDHLVGQLSTQGQPNTEPIPATYTSKAGKPAHAATTCIQTDPDHHWVAMHSYVDTGKMDGFGNSYQMTYYDKTDLPFYYWFASTFTLADRYFPSVLASTTPNRLYLQYASSGGAHDTGDSHVPMSGVDDRLHAKGLKTASYNASNFTAFQTALMNGSLADVVYVNSGANTTDEHPPANVQEGEAWTRQVVMAIVSSPTWATSAFFWTYDEGGGFFDHVPPGHSCHPNDGTPSEADFTELGIRVPLVIASPFARRNYVSHVVHEHTSITRFIETVFDLGALTERDANSDALLDMFDFSCPNMTPAPAAPAAGTGGCH